MRQTAKYEFWVGLFLLLAIAAFAFLGLKVANVQGFSQAKSYQITATFDNIGGLKVRAPLKVGGVVIGRVTDIELDPKTYVPVVKIAINQEYDEIPDNSSISIKTAGLLGSSIWHSIWALMTAKPPKCSKRAAKWWIPNQQWCWRI